MAANTNPDDKTPAITNPVQPKAGSETQQHSPAGANDGWEEVHREYDIESNGQKKLKKISVERRTRHEKTDFLLRIIGSSAILISLAGLIFSMWQQRLQTAFQISQERALFELGIYDKAISNLNNMLLRNRNDENYQKAKLDLKFETLPKIMLLNDTALNKSFARFFKVADFGENISVLRDSLHNFESHKYYFIMSFRSLLNNLSSVKARKKFLLDDSRKGISGIYYYLQPIAWNIERDSLSVVSTLELLTSRDSATKIYGQMAQNIRDIFEESRQFLYAEIDSYDIITKSKKITRLKPLHDSLVGNEIYYPGIIGRSHFDLSILEFIKNSCAAELETIQAAIANRMREINPLLRR